MHSAFISIIGVIQSYQQVRVLGEWLTGIHGEMSARFTDHEFVLVNNGIPMADLDAVIRPLPEAVRQQVYLLNLSIPVDKNNALLAGLDRANGDYTAIFEFEFAGKPQLITQMWEKSRDTSCDMVYLRARERKLSAPYRVLYGGFYHILKKYSGLKIDPLSHTSRLISRRALNSLLRLRENSQYIKAIFALVGYNTAWLEVPEPLHSDANSSWREQFRTALVAITSFTTFLRTLLLWIFGFSVLVAGTAIFNAVKVKLTHVDIFGDYQEVLSGWAFLVVLMSVFFAITCLTLYIMSIYLSNIYAEIKNRPLYIIESVKRY